jgi:hypothetical protein
VVVDGRGRQVLVVGQAGQPSLHIPTHAARELLVTVAFGEKVAEALKVEGNLLLDRRRTHTMDDELLVGAGPGSYCVRQLGDLGGESRLHLS